MITTFLDLRNNGLCFTQINIFKFEEQFFVLRIFRALLIICVSFACIKAQPTTPSVLLNYALSPRILSFSQKPALSLSGRKENQ